MAREVVTGPVVCGPVGFRKVPLQSRWGEYVRVTVSAPGALRGTVLVHAGGAAQEPRTWNTESGGALVVDVRFPNEDVDQRFALERERPIDLTLTGLEGACEGAVFTVEHGELVPSIDERAWLAELERRGGPELAARREAARLEADARRQAHYAQWEARQVEVSTQVVAQATLAREAHYAQWEARHAIAGAQAVAMSTSGEVAAGGGLAMSGSVVAPGGGGPDFGGGVAASNVGKSGNSASCASGTCAGPNLGGGVAASGGVSGNSASCASGTCAGPNFGGGVAASNVGNSASCASGTCAGPNFGGGGAASGGVSGNTPCASGTCAGPNFGSGAAAPGGVGGNTPCASGTCAGQNFGGGVTTPPQCTSGTCSLPGFGGEVAASGGNSASCASGTCSGQRLGGEVSVAIAPVPLRDTTAVSTVSLPGEWTRPPDATLRAPVDTTWVQPPDAQLRATATIESSWEQPAVEPHLEPVAVTTESRVVTTQQPRPPACDGNCAQPVDPALSVFVPAMFHLMFNVAAGASQQQPAHAAQPVPPRR